jgi:hypothetical protein
MSCRFYGKHQTSTGHPLDQMGNQCGAITYAYVPCFLELDGDVVDENACATALQEIATPNPHSGHGARARRVAGLITILKPSSDT